MCIIPYDDFLKNSLLGFFIDWIDVLLVLLVWTPCLMHMCVCIWRYILQNYNYKPHFQNLSINHIPHASIGTLAAENLDVCIVCDLWNINIQLTMGKDQRRQIYVGFVIDIEIKILGWPPLGLGVPFLDSDTCTKEGGGGVWCHPWMDGKLHKKWPQHPLLHVIRQPQTLGWTCF